MKQNEIESRILEIWEKPEHFRSRFQPCVTDPDYFHLTDLLQFLNQFATTDKLTVLDYGAGSSPYQSLFPRADYRKADIIGAAGLQYHLPADSTVSEKDETFDLILSTQVAEHVANPDTYFRECFRLLKKGGKLILTTHGTWEEHGVPWDFQRWTEQGMRRDLRHAGFMQPKIHKVTCGFRAIMLLFSRTYFAAPPPASWLPQKAFKLMRFTYSRLFVPLINLWGDKYWSHERIVVADEDKVTSPFYIVIAAVAEKPE